VKLAGRSIIGFRDGSTDGPRFRALNPATGETLEPDFYSASAEEVNQAASLAHEAFATYRNTSGADKATFLRTIASNIETIADRIVERGTLETALPKKRLQGETGRTCYQLRFFAELVEEGSWLMARIDRQDDHRKPLAKPDIRSMLRPLGPVAVFGASNFPLAFSVAGGDTASALAAGCPVIVKGHSAHPGTGELVGRAVRQAVRSCNMPEGVFSLLFAEGSELATALVKHPIVKASAFTGSRQVGRLLMNVAASRPEPIPFYAEMSSANPVFILPEALRQNAETIAAGLHASFTLGAGQFCTKPGMVFVQEGPDAAKFSHKLHGYVTLSSPFHLLTSVIHEWYTCGINERRAKAGVNVIAEGAHGAELGVAAALFETDAVSFMKDHDLAGEIFGPATLLVRYSQREEILHIATELEGNLTATIHGTEQDVREFSDLISILEEKVGRLVFNAFPTGVEVCHAVVHGGPFPATSDGRSTSVGTQAIYRFCRPLCYQNFPDSVLPKELKNDNPLGIWRMVDGEMTRVSTTGPGSGVNAPA
jgi:alpha-ketoglutaric semialdehyde dehydrogenase